MFVCRLPASLSMPTFFKNYFIFYRMKFLKLLWWNMARTSGLELLPCSTGNLPSSARPDGMNGWTPASRRLNGAVKKMRNFYIWPNSCPLSGGPLHRLLGEQLLSALSDMNIYCKQFFFLNNVSTKYLILNYLQGSSPEERRRWRAWRWSS